MMSESMNQRIHALPERMVGVARTARETKCTCYQHRGQGGGKGQGRKENRETDLWEPSEVCNRVYPCAALEFSAEVRETLATLRGSMGKVDADTTQSKKVSH